MNKSSSKYIYFSLSLFFLFCYISVKISSFDFQLDQYFYRFNDMLTLNSKEFAPEIWKFLLLIPSVFFMSLFLFEIFKEKNLSFELISKRRLILFLSAFFSLLLLIYSINYVFKKTEITDDENAYFFQAQILQNGKLYSQPPPTLENFKNVFIIIDSTKWTSKYTLGHPITLALGMFLGSPYIFTVFFSILLIFLTYLTAKELNYDTKIALLSSVLLSCSPFFYAVASTKLSHTSSSFFLSLSLFLFLKAANTQNQKIRLLLFVGFGFAIGFAFLIRQLTTVAFGLAIMVWWISDVIEKKYKFWELPVTAGIVCFLFLVFSLYYNKIITGNPFIFPFNYYEPNESLGFGIKQFENQAFTHDPLNGFKNLSLNLARFNSWALGFPIFLFFIFFVLKNRLKSQDKFILSVIIFHSISYIFYYSPGIGDVGPIYYYELLPLFLILFSKAFFEIKNNLLIFSDINLNRRFLNIFLITVIFYSFIFFYQEKAEHIRRLTFGISVPYQNINELLPKGSIALIKNVQNVGWVFGIRNPSPNLDDDIIICRYADPMSNQKLIEYFKNRYVFTVEFDEQKQQYRITQIR